MIIIYIFENYNITFENTANNSKTMYASYKSPFFVSWELPNFKAEKYGDYLI